MGVFPNRLNINMMITNKLWVLVPKNADLQIEKKLEQRSCNLITYNFECIEGYIVSTVTLCDGMVLEQYYQKNE